MEVLDVRLNRMMLREFLRAVWSGYVARFSGPASVVLFVVGFVLQPQRLRFASLIVAAICFVISAYAIWANEHRRVLAFEERRFEILFEAEPSACVHEGPPEPPGYRLYRAGVKNLSQRTIDDVRLGVVHLEPISITCLPLYLQVMNRPGSNDAGSLHPGEVRYFDLVHQMPDGSVHIVHVTSSAPSRIPSERTLLTVRAAGGEARPEERVFLLDFVERRLRVTPQDAMHGRMLEVLG